jgi:hypothetical protein
MAVAICIGGQTFINSPGAVIVYAVAHLCGARVHVAIGVIAVSLDFAIAVSIVVHLVTGKIGSAAILVDTVTAYLRSARIDATVCIVAIIVGCEARVRSVMAVAICIGGQTFINPSGAVVVNAVANLCGFRVHVGIGVVAVSLVFAIAVSVVVFIVAGKIGSVAILIDTVTAYLCGARVDAIACIVAVIVRCEARVRSVMAVAIRIGGQTFINSPGAVIVYAVAHLCGARVHVAIGVIAVSLDFAISVSVVVHLVTGKIGSAAILVDTVTAYLRGACIDATVCIVAIIVGCEARVRSVMAVFICIGG